MFEIIFFVFICIYFIQTVLFIVGASKKFERIKGQELPTATIIVAARNEEANILRCLKSLDKLIYPENKLEIIIVNDRSTDNTGKIIDEFISGKSGFKKIDTEKTIGELKGKTNALANAIQISSGEIILTTDADCEVNPNWVKTIASYYTMDVGVVCGFTNQDAYNQFSGMQALDFIYLLLVASGTINLGYPVSCIGNNMSYRKKAYEDVGGYESLPFSVTEDSNLLLAISRLKKYKIIYPVDVDTLVTSKACSTYNELFRQKKRWAVGGIDVPIRGYFVMASGFAANLGIILTPLFFSGVWLYLSAFKLATDFFLLYPAHEKLGIKKNLKYFLSFEIYYTLYVLALPFVLLFNRKVIWKNREY
jgi:cellulose synthase/poly-beta-1,6-N-acetylglucosamine synthase-like glycosyltransferase